MLRFGMSGCGAFIQKAVLPMLARVDLLQVVAAYDTNQALLEKVCADFYIARACASFEELLAAEAVDVIYVASPNVFHKAQVIAAAGSGKHIFCQKPMAMNAVECEDMLAACRKAGVRLGMGFCYRFQGAQQLAKALIASGAIGDVSHIHFSFNLGGFTRQTVGWRCERRLSGGGPLMDIAPHLIDLAAYLLEDRVESVMAYVEEGQADEDVETDAVVMLRCAKGATVSLDTSFVRRNQHQYAITGTQGEIRARGTMAWQSGGQLELYRHGQWEQMTFALDEHIETELRLFGEAIEVGSPLPVPGEAGLHVQRVIDAIYQSGRTGQRCRVVNS